MERRLISASLSEQALTFRPGGSPVSFDVNVVNESDQFAAFQVVVVAPGADPNRRWYTLSPEISTKKPPGSRTSFRVAIMDTPIPGFMGMVNLTVRIFSSDLKDERKYLVRLVIEEGSGPSQLTVDLPVRQFQVYPSNLVEVPVSVRNLSQQSADVILKLVGLDPGWVTGGLQRRLQVEAGQQIEATFACQPPSVTQAMSATYPFTIEATPATGGIARVEGSLEILPIGFIQFSAEPTSQQIPEKGDWLPSMAAPPVQYELRFKNASNILQEVQAQVQGSAISCRFIPTTAPLSPGQTARILLETQCPRPWLGFPQTLRLEAEALLSDERLGKTDPATQRLELRILPVIPLWLQILALLLIALILAFLLSRPPAVQGHTDFVNTVRFSGDALSILSGSDDRTIRRWTVNGDNLEGQGILATTDKSVRTLRFQPENNNQVAAGLENGAVQLWNVATGELGRSFSYQEGDRVFDLVFTRDSHFLFSGHGSGLILRWNLQTADPKPQQILSLPRALNYTVQTLALGPDGKTLASAGRFNRLILWDLSEPQAIPRRLSPRGGENDLIWSVAFAQDRSGMLATGDSKGDIILWDLTACKSTAPTDPTFPKESTCPVLDRWQGHGGSAVRSVVLSADGRTLVSGGDDGRAVFWSLTPTGKREPRAVTGQELVRLPLKVNSVDLTRDRTGSLVVVGSDDQTVTLRRIPTDR